VDGFRYLKIGIFLWWIYKLECLVFILVNTADVVKIAEVDAWLVSLQELILNGVSGNAINRICVATGGTRGYSSL
jgi:hypothetical protein